MKRMIFAAAAAGVLVLAGCSGGQGPGREAKTFKVRTEKVAKRNFSSEENYSGTIRSRETVNISTKMMGRVLKLHVEEGTAVKKGQLLVEVDAAEAQSAFRQSEAGLKAAEVNGGNMERDLERFRRLYEEKAVTRHQLEQMEAGAAAAAAQKEQARASVEMSRTLLSYGKIYSPFDGVVSRKWIEPGNLAAPGMPILTVENPSALEVLVEVPEEKAGRIPPGSAARLYPGGGDAHVETKVLTVVPTADAFTKTSTVRLEAPAGGVKPGQFARVRFDALGGETLSLPASAVVKDGQLETVFVRDEAGKASLRIVRTGRVENGYAQVVAGIDEGADAVVSPPPAMREGDKLEAGQ